MILLNATPQFDNVGQLIETVVGGDWAEQGEPFLMLDGARLSGMRAWLRRKGSGVEWNCLLGGNIDSDMLEASPVLVRLSAEASDRFLLRILNDPVYRRAASFLVSRQSLAELAEHFEKHLYIDDPDGTRWGLAFWDPFILSSLVGARPSASTIVPGPVLSPVQCASLLAPVALWCIRGRDGNPYAIRLPVATDEKADLPFALDQRQMNQLADIPLPDQMLEVLIAAMPELTSAGSDVALHQLCCRAVLQSREENQDHLAGYTGTAFNMLTSGNLKKERDK